MSRRNSDRIGGHRDSQATPPVNAAPPEGFSFVVPTEFVELPSEGRYYPEDHPLHGQQAIEIKQMTAKEEDILTSRALIQKGLALDRLISSLIVDKSISPDSLLVGDRNAIIIAARISGYGPEYNTKVSCPSCSTEQRFTFDISEPNVHYGGTIEREDIVVTEVQDGEFEVNLPVTKFKVTFGLMTGGEERAYMSQMEKNKKSNKAEKNVTMQLMTIIKKVNDVDPGEHKRYIVDNLPSRDSRHLRMAYRIASPTVDLIQHFECSNCGHSTNMEVPLSADFFWPDA